MRFPSAQAGVQKLFTAQLLRIIALVCSVIAGVGVATTVVSLMNLNDGGTVAFSALSVIFGIAYGVLSIIALILEIIGLSRAQRDDNNFRIAFFAAIASIVLTIVAVFFQSSPVVNSILELLSRIAGIAVMVFVVLGIQAIARQLADSALAAKAKRLLMIIICVNGAYIIIDLIAGILQNSPTALTISGILAIVASIVGIISIILYLMLLKHAKESFKA